MVLSFYLALHLIAKPLLTLLLAAGSDGFTFAAPIPGQKSAELAERPVENPACFHSRSLTTEAEVVSGDPCRGCPQPCQYRLPIYCQSFSLAMPV